MLVLSIVAPHALKCVLLMLLMLLVMLVMLVMLVLQSSC